MCASVGISAACDGKLPSNLQAGGGDLQVLADIVAVEHGVDVGQVDFLVGELTALLQDWTEGTAAHSFATATFGIAHASAGPDGSTHTDCQGSTARRIRPAS